MRALDQALAEKSAHENGWENVASVGEDALALSSARHRARLRLTGGEDTGWYVEGVSAAVARELTRDFSPVEAGGTRFAVPTLCQLGRLLRRIAELALSLPNQAEVTYEARVSAALAGGGLDRTAAERLVRQRIGQDTFREALLDYWGGSCAVTGLALPDVLRASHAKPWAQCASDAERLDVYNGFLLAAHLDALFDRGLVTFSTLGVLEWSGTVTATARQSLVLDRDLRLRWLAPGHLPYLEWHRSRCFVP